MTGSTTKDHNLHSQPGARHHHLHYGFVCSGCGTTMKDAKYDRSLPLYIHRAYQDDDWIGFSNFVINVGSYEWWGDQMIERVIPCSEKWAAFDPAIVAQLIQGSFLSGWDVSLAQNQAFTCKNVPPGETPEGLDPQPGSQVPVLILNGEPGPIDSPDNMAGASTLWPSSLILTAPYQGHAFSNRTATDCWFSIMSDFIQTGSAKGLNASCMENVPPMTFRLP